MPETTIIPTTHRRNVWRTVWQAVVGGAVAIPAAIVALTAAGADVPAGIVAWTSGTAAAFVVIASAVQNALEARGDA